MGTLLKIFAFLALCVGGILIFVGRGDSVFLSIGAAWGSALTLYVSGAVLDALADIRDDARRSAVANERAVLALDKLTERRSARPANEANPTP